MSKDRLDMKVVLLGKSFSGKTCLVERYIHNHFREAAPYQNTIGAAFGAKKVQVGKTLVTVNIWDTAGSERYESMSKIYYRSAKAAILCYDITDKTSFDRVRFWVGELRKNEENCKIYLCGNKLDLVQEGKEERKIDPNEARALLHSDCLTGFYETSSKTGESIGDLFDQIIDDFLKAAEAEEPPKQDTFQLRERMRPGSKCLCKSS